MTGSRWKSRSLLTIRSVSEVWCGPPSRSLISTGAVNAARAQAVGLVAQLAGEGEALKVARATAAQITKFDATTRAVAKKFLKPIPYAELKQEVEIFCELFARPAVLAALKKFVESTDAMPYLP